MGDSGVKYVKAGMRLANDVNVDDLYDAGGSADISGYPYLGPLRDKTGSCATYETMRLAEGITCSDMEPLFDTINQIGDPYEVRFRIRDKGDGSFTMPMFIKQNTSIVDGHNLDYAMQEFPDGITGSITSGSPGTADEAAVYDPVDDPVTSFGFGDGYGGYNVVLESQYSDAGSTKYNQIFFDNCRISPGKTYNAQQVNRITVNFVARQVRIVQGAGSSVLV